MRRLGRGLGKLLLAVVMLGGIGGMHTLILEDHQKVAPIETHGTIGELVDTGGFGLEVQRVRVSRTLIPSSSFGDKEKPVRTDGMFVVLTATLVPAWEPTNYDNAWLETPEGERYRVSERADPGFTTALTGDDRMHPGIARRGAIVFEMPADAVSGAVLHLGRTQARDVRLGPMAVIDLQLSDDRTEQLLAEAPEQIILEPVEFG